jgi:hypothetical protein
VKAVTYAIFVKNSPIDSETLISQVDDYLQSKGIITTTPVRVDALKYIIKSLGVSGTSTKFDCDSYLGYSKSDSQYLNILLKSGSFTTELESPADESLAQFIIRQSLHENAHIWTSLKIKNGILNGTIKEADLIAAWNSNITQNMYMSLGLLVEIFTPTQILSGQILGSLRHLPAFFLLGVMPAIGDSAENFGASAEQIYGLEYMRQAAGIDKTDKYRSIVSINKLLAGFPLTEDDLSVSGIYYWLGLATYMSHGMSDATIQDFLSSVSTLSDCPIKHIILESISLADARVVRLFNNTSMNLPTTPLGLDQIQTCLALTQTSILVNAMPVNFNVKTKDMMFLRQIYSAAKSASTDIYTFWKNKLASVYDKLDPGDYPDFRHYPVESDEIARIRENEI